MWVGLLYDDAALDAAWDRVRHWTIEEREALRHAVPARGARRAGAGRRDGARAGRARCSRSPPPASAPRAELNASGDNESGFLDPLRDVVASGMTFADRLLERYHGEWNGDVSRVYDEFSF